MGRPPNLNKSIMSTIALPEKFKEEHRLQKPSKWTWSRYIESIVLKLSYYEENYKIEKANHEVYKSRYQHAEKIMGLYSNFILELTRAQSFEELRNKIQPVIASNGSINIGALLHQ